ncbi:MAG: citramalate synthase [Nitrososphaerota archaeon]|jgi:2-isopropylmalate synthase|nr:citramalate synthase [Nitrososphaerota archaeon]MDG6927296.1 citramalate synthase [Nitrososphaerota archaeon]MDG6930346.1 citramalate synthase [Nitrososphaerota archaeon]MDG6931702.1 citramalate synthase [Nitrososphaerota archaeon]MDG6936750.1 citramalate synthase [Nitrososphaerota archaeon]
MDKVEILDTTLRDGSQMAGVNFTLEDKLDITKRLDELGVDFIEGGWPGSNPKDINYFKEVKKIPIAYSKISAFGSTKRKPGSEDRNLETIIQADTEFATLFGKTWKLHVKEVLKLTPAENLSLIGESIDYLKSHGIKVIYDAEHFFDGYRDDPEYALSTLRAASGAYAVVLADTNGGTLTHVLSGIIQEVKRKFPFKIGIHAHNDSGVAVANSLMAVEQGASHVQGTINGLGERCGNADLVQIIPALELKMGLRALNNEGGLRALKDISSYVYGILNIRENPYQPYVGKYAFTHKGGVHIDAMMKDSRTYEHIDPERVGNVRNYVVSELSGRAALLKYSQELGLELEKDHPAVIKSLGEIKELEAYGIVENADATVKLIILKNLGIYADKFNVLYWMANARDTNGRTESEGEVIVRVDNEVHYEREFGVGPVHALDNALRKVIVRVFEILKTTELLNYKVSVTEGDSKGTASYVRVFIEFGDRKLRWSTTGVSKNILEASVKALTDGYNYRLALEELSRLDRLE